jgi:hypothetical protein
MRGARALGFKRSGRWPCRLPGVCQSAGRRLAPRVVAFCSARRGVVSQTELLFPLVGDSGGVWSLVHVAEAAEATMAAIERGSRGVYNVVDIDLRGLDECARRNRTRSRAVALTLLASRCRLAVLSTHGARQDAPNDRLGSRVQPQGDVSAGRAWPRPSPDPRHPRRPPFASCLCKERPPSGLERADRPRGCATTES